MSKEELIAFEKEVADLFKAGKIRCPIHLSGGNEDTLINLFDTEISGDDYVFSTHRNHYHYLLHTGKNTALMIKILAGDSMHTCDPEANFYTSSIVSGCVAIACGVAYALKEKGSKQRVWCFIGDGATDEGWLLEAWKYAVYQDLPITYVVENNNRSVCSTTEQRWGKYIETTNGPKLIKYNYTCTYPHVGIGKFVNLECGD
jgi:pyruvate dehydrogenase E1 component alpha subunit